LSRQCGILNISQPYRPPRSVTGMALFYNVKCLKSLFSSVNKLQKRGSDQIWNYRTFWQLLVKTQLTEKTIKYWQLHVVANCEVIYRLEDVNFIMQELVNSHLNQSQRLYMYQADYMLFISRFFLVCTYSVVLTKSWLSDSLVIYYNYYYYGWLRMVPKLDIRLDKQRKTTKITSQDSQDSKWCLLNESEYLLVHQHAR
jgi:hypothetical protein